MKLLGIDFETQGADIKTTNITEVGAILYGALSKPLELSELVYDESYPPQTDQIVELTSITDAMLKKDGKHPRVVLASLMPLMMDADYIFAHKVAFDKGVLFANCERLGIILPEKPWICTLSDFPWPPRCTSKKLGHLAYDHDIPHDRKNLHRALDDVKLMMELVFKYDPEKVIAYAKEPWVYLHADIFGPWLGKGGDGGVQKGIAQGLGFSWEKVKGMEEPVFSKKWVSRCKEHEVAGIMERAGASSSPFRINRI